MSTLRLASLTAWTLVTLSGLAGCGDKKTCADLSCADKQLCQEGDPPACAPACQAGFSWNGTACEASATAVCAPAPAAGSIVARCDLDQRVCVETVAGQASCGACKTGFVEMSGQCVARQECSTLNCSAQNRRCEANPTARCTSCLDGFVEDGMSCRPIKTCADTVCMPGLTCMEVMGSDAQCTMGGCGMGQVPSASGSGCVRCFLDCASRPGGTGRVFPDAATLADTCVCETQPGFFWDEGAGGGGDVRPCDADGDGWVRVTAKRAVDRTNDRAVRENARCDVRRIDRFVLENDEGTSREVVLTTPAELYEPERVDDAALLADAVAQGTLARPDSRSFEVAELNTLTKACVWKNTPEQRADFNQNGIEDLDEAHDDPRLDNPNDPLSPLYDYTYFIELFRGFYEPPAMGTGPGRYVIQERSRAAQPADPTLAIPVGIAASDGGEYWRQCSRLRDRNFAEGQPGFDFGRYNNPMAWAGMGHSSQFRCLRVVSQPSGRGNEATPEEIAQNWTLNRCQPGASRPPSTAGVENPSEPAFVCTLAPTPEPRTSTTAPVFLAVSRYRPYDDEFNVTELGTYLRGCINECRERPFLCPGYSPIDPGLQCLGALDDFGRLRCGCARSFGGPECQLACPGDLQAPGSGGLGSLFTSPDFDPVPRAGLWMCGVQNSGSSAPLVGQVAGSTSTWGLLGEVSAPSTVPVTDVCAPDGMGGCSFRIRASTF